MITSLRMSRKGVQVEVEVGRTKHGSPITATARFQRADLEEVLRPLDEAVTTSVRATLEEGRTQLELDTRVREAVDKERAAIAHRAQVNAEHALKVQHKTELEAVRRELVSVQRELQASKAENDRLRTTPATTTTEKEA